MSRDRALPDGWKVLPFKQIAESITERVDDPSAAGVDRYVGLDHLDPESTYIRRWGSPDDVGSTKLRFYPGDVVYARRRAYQRKLGVADFEGICSAHALVLRARPEACLPEFLPYFLQSDAFHERALDISVGSLSPTINWKALAVQEFVLPPVDHQRSIVEVLDHVSELIDRQLLARERVQTMVAALGARLVPADSADADATLGDLCSVQVGYPFSSSNYSPDGIRLLRCSNVAVGSLHWEAVITRLWPRDQLEEYTEYALSSGDVVIAMDRPFVTEGFKISRVEASDLPALLLQRVGRLVPNPDVSPESLWAILRAPATPRHLQARQRGTDLPHISRFDIEAIPILRGAVDDLNLLAEVLAAESVLSGIGQSIAATQDLRRRTASELLDVQ